MTNVFSGLPWDMKMTNVFSGLPWDMKREISTFLERDDGASFNEVLRRDERVYKKFPKDFALKHALRILREEHNSIMRRIQFHIDRDDMRALRRADVETHVGG